MKRLKRHLRAAIVVAVVIGGIRFAQDLQDWSKLLTYQPSPEIARLATATTMTDTARRLFYVNQPTIESTKSALNLCKSSEHTVVLGCYVSSKGIFLQAVTDPRLKGVMEVTAAHEMLHVAYQRMSLFEQTQINKQLQAVLERLQNPRIIKIIQVYNEQDPRSVDHELHSILGTEVRDLSPELEEHYRKYFTDRSAIVALSERYEGVFTGLKDKAKQLSKQLAAQNLELEQLAARIKQEKLELESAQTNLQSSIDANPHIDYGAQVSSFKERVSSYNQLVVQLRSQNDAYNQLVNERNSLTVEQQSLIESLENKSTQQVAR
jgi:allophanate hydrolase subunit 1